MTVGERIDLLISTDNYLTERAKLNDSFIDMMKFMFSEKFKIIEQKEESYQTLISRFKELNK